jgi:hypothetical protein
MNLRQLELFSLGTFSAVMLFSLVTYRAFQSIEPQPQRPISAAEVCR